MKIILSMIAICLFSFGVLIGCDKAEEPKKNPIGFDGVWVMITAFGVLKNEPVLGLLFNLS